jgi:hypothetical protein
MSALWNSGCPPGSRSRPCGSSTTIESLRASGLRQLASVLVEVPPLVSDNSYSVNVPEQKYIHGLTSSGTTCKIVLAEMPLWRFLKTRNDCTMVRLIPVSSSEGNLMARLDASGVFRLDGSLPYWILVVVIGPLKMFILPPVHQFSVALLPTPCSFATPSPRSLSAFVPTGPDIRPCCRSVGIHTSNCSIFFCTAPSMASYPRF